MNVMMMMFRIYDYFDCGKFVFGKFSNYGFNFSNFALSLLTKQVWIIVYESKSFT